MSSRRIKTRGGRQGGSSESSPYLSRYNIDYNTLLMHQKRLMRIFPELNDISSRILLDLTHGDFTSSCDNVLYARDLGKEVLSSYNKTRGLAFRDSVNECPEQTVTPATDMLLIPVTDSGQNVLDSQIANETVLTENSAVLEVPDNEDVPEQSYAQFENLSQFENEFPDTDLLLLNNVNYISEANSQPLTELTDLEQILQDTAANSDGQSAENEDPQQQQICLTYTEPPSISYLQMPEIVVPAQKSGQKPNGIKIGETTYLVKKSPFINNPELLQKLVTLPVQCLKSSE